MNYKKTKFFKFFLPISLTGLIIAVPIVAASCTTTSKSDSTNNDTNNGGNNNGSTPNGDSGQQTPSNPTPPSSGSGGNQGETDTTPSNPTPPVTVVAPSISTKIQDFGDISKIFNFDFQGSLSKNIDQNVSKLLSSQASQVITNYNSLSSAQKQNLKIEFNGQYPTQTQWGTIGYDEWSKKDYSTSPPVIPAPETQKAGENQDNSQNKVPNIPTPIYYNVNSPMNFEVSSLEQFHNLFTSEKLKEIFTQILNDDQTNFTYSLVNDCSFGYTNNDKIVHLNVNQHDGNKNTNQKFNLGIPVSNIVLKINGTLTVYSDAIQKITVPNFSFDYSIGLNQEIKKDLNITPINVNGSNEINVENVIDKLGWTIKENSDPSAPKASGDESSGTNTTYKINSSVVGNQIGLFNIDFSNIQLNTDNQEIGLYSLEITGKPKQGYYWDDKTNLERKFTISNLYVYIQNSIYNGSNTHIEQPWGINARELKDITKQEENYLDSFTDEYVNQYFKDNNQFFLDFATFLTKSFYRYYAYITVSFAKATVIENTPKNGAEGEVTPEQKPTYSILLTVNINAQAGHSFVWPSNNPDNPNTVLSYFLIDGYQLKPTTDPKN